MSAFQLAQLLIMYGPEAVQAIIKIVNIKDPTDADWAALWAKVQQKSYDDYINAARAAAGTP